MLKNRIIRNIFSNYVGFVLTMLVMLYMVPFLLGELGMATYGAWILVNVFFAYFALIELGLMPAVIRHVSQALALDDRDKVERTVGSACAVLMRLSLISVPILIVIICLAGWAVDLDGFDRRTFVTATVLMGLIAVIDFFRRLQIAVLEGHSRFDLLNAIEVARTFAGAAASIIAVKAGHGLLALVVIRMAETVVEIAALNFFIRRDCGIRVNPRLADPEIRRRLKDYSKFAFLVDLAVNVSHRIDGLVIALMMATPFRSIAYYDVGTKIAGVLEKITDPLIDTLFPLASELDTNREPEAMRQLLMTGTRVSVMIITPFLIMLSAYGGDAIGWWFMIIPNDKVPADIIAMSLPILHIFLGAVFMAVFDATASRVLLGTGQVKFDATISLGAAILNLTLSLILVWKLGIIGVALGTLIPATICNLFISVPYTCRLCGLPVHRLYIAVFVPLLALAALSYGVMALTSLITDNRVITFIIDGTVVSLICGTMLLRLLKQAAVVARELDGG